MNKTETRPFLASDTELGDAPTPETIRSGTVTMEDHPDYLPATASLEDDGFRLVPSQTGYAHVSMNLIRHPQDKRVSHIEKTVSVIPKMRWIDLQHEMLHVDQILTRFLAQGWLLFTDFTDLPKAGSHASHRPGKQSPEPGLITNWQNTIMEYHARLQEYKMLKETGVDQPRLKTHAEGVMAWEIKCWKQGMRRLKSPSRLQWVNRHFPDIFELDEEVQSLIAEEFPWIAATKQRINKLA